MALTFLLLFPGIRGSLASPHTPARVSSASISPGAPRDATPSRAGDTVIRIAPTQGGLAFAPGSVGLSVETEDLSTQSLSANHRSLVALMRRLGPGSLRIGGNSLDYSWWTSSAEAAPSWATNVVTPADLARLRALLDATDWMVILGVDLGHADPPRAADEARAAARLLGPHLLGFEVGNEPNAYRGEVVALRPRSYTPAEYLSEVAEYAAAIQQAVPAARLYGPDLSSHEWQDALSAHLGGRFAAFTEHYYPTLFNTARGACKPTSIPTAADLLSPGVRAQENSVLEGLATIRALSHAETRITETNTTSSCDASGGPATSPVFASALWALDWILRAASMGVAGINFHGAFGLCAPNTFSPICAPTATAAARGEVVPRPEYYGLVAARELEGGTFLPVAVLGATPMLTAYATLHPSGLVTVAVDNLNSRVATSVLLTLPGYARATSAVLTGPRLASTTGVTFGARTLTFGTSNAPHQALLSRLGNSFRLVLRPASASVVTLL